ncbi:hypothetical protein BD310DRAFT_53028 [Dichomitus squalens]|uniref:Uncharacterized protein n=1 Tax=Dichomitus squalens TaxID=114155 RepID=A0A4Q9Q519_9APHY|nr:hypothetical protein BD310DRAFT_53028 [Dichomitus squalens]
MSIYFFLPSSTRNVYAIYSISSKPNSLYHSLDGYPRAEIMFALLHGPKACRNVSKYVACSHQPWFKARNSEESLRCRSHGTCSFYVHRAAKAWRFVVRTVHSTHSCCKERSRSSAHAAHYIVMTGFVITMAICRQGACTGTCTHRGSGGGDWIYWELQMS